jgi:uncharacterized protein YqgC (DUF456 family)
MDVLIWGLTVLLLLTGLAGCMVPLLPGTTLILAGVVLHKLLLPDQLPWLAVGIVAVVWLASVLADFAGIMLGTRLGGGGKWGMTGAGGGALVGLCFSLPALLIGTFLGAVAAERFIARKSGGAVWCAGLGATAGYLLATVARVACACAMIALFLAASLGGYALAD